MSSLKDWYRYVDSKARSRPESGAPPERPGAAPPRPEQASDPAGERPEGHAGPEAEEASSPSDAPAVSEEGLDVWSGLFPQARKPEPKPTTAPLKRPTASRDEVLPDLPFAQASLESPPAPEFPLPDAQVEIPSFDTFVSPFTPTPPSATPAAGPPPGAPPPSLASQGHEGGSQPPVNARGSAVNEGPPAAGREEALNSVATPGTTAAAPALDAALGPGFGVAPSSPAPPEPAIAAAATPPNAAPGSPDEASSSAVSATESESMAAETPAVDDGQVRWHSPFGLPGPGRTVSSGAPSPRPEPTVPRSIPVPGSPTDQGGEPAPQGPDSVTPPAARPAPGTVAWERERVERLARTFRETLRALEESLNPARTPVLPSAENGAAGGISAREAAAAPPTPTVPIEPPSAEAQHIPAPEPAAPTTPDSTREAITAAEAASPTIRKPDARGETEDRAAVSDNALAAEPARVSEPVAPSPRRPVASSLPRPATAAPAPDVLRNIEEAALIRQRLPQHMAMLLRIPTNEIAQNSYKSPFRETREDLIGRLLDPQLTLEEAARILGVCPTTVRRYTNRGMLDCHRTPGNQRRFRMSDVLQFLEQYGDRIDRAAEARQLEETAQ